MRPEYTFCLFNSSSECELADVPIDGACCATTHAAAPVHKPPDPAPRVPYISERAEARLHTEARALDWRGPRALGQLVRHDRQVARAAGRRAKLSSNRKGGH
jgi:hypothetical protein